MKSTKVIASVAIAGGLAAGGLALGAGVANADPGIAAVPTDWRPPPPRPWNGPGWGGPVGWAPPPAWGPPPPPPPPPWGAPAPGLCLFDLCLSD
ncbi:hypothetical protein [Mycobacterium sp.]|uniref:hypothetical protein n=1 Tax=Mycobacterium sp. TaxID=1785 RepID=UPI002C9CF59D|nr:hypothetical protein [Mycobacterium sp.]HKP39844.1 hypothetical protein [Mycobacterium sp.]